MLMKQNMFTRFELILFSLLYVWIFSPSVNSSTNSDIIITAWFMYPHGSRLQMDLD